jgi:hypothetical protein
MIHRAGENFSFGKNLRTNKKALVKDRVKKAYFMLKKKKMVKYGNYNIPHILCVIEIGTCRLTKRNGYLSISLT